VGWLDQSGDGEFAIALRCGLVEGRSATLFTGAGIVEGSDPHLEYEETRIKLRPMMSALGLS
jgi:menaquinone-specific isochorismate synthase